MNLRFSQSLLKLILCLPALTCSSYSSAAETGATPPKLSESKAAVKVSPSRAVKDGGVEFFALGRPSMLKIHGESHAMTGELVQNGKELTGEFKIPLNSFTTGMTTRDNHLKEKVFETSKFETATLKITSLALPTELGVFKNLPFQGKLNLHGVEKDVTGSAAVTVAEKITDFAAHVEIKLTDYSITPPEFMGMSIQDDVKIEAKGSGKAAI